MSGMNVETPPLPAGLFSTVVADPPWDYSRKFSGGGTSGYSPVHHSRGGNRGAANHYNTMTLDDIMRLPVDEVVADQAHLWLWTTGAFMVEAHQVAEAWGFSPKGVIPWIKVKKDAVRHVQREKDLRAAVRMGMGLYVRWASEFVVFAVKGKLPAMNHDVMGVVFAERRDHSEKPDELYELVEAVSPSPRLELFARTPRPGYEVWGLEVGNWMPSRANGQGPANQGVLFPEPDLEPHQ